MKTNEDKKKVSDAMKAYGILTVGSLLIIAGVYFFKFPNNFSFGGVTGIAVVLNKVSRISASSINFILNTGLVVVGFLVLGKSFGLKTFYVSMLTSIGLSALEHFFPMSGPMTDQPVLELIFAVFLPAAGSAILFNAEASGGGTDIIAMIIKKYSEFNISIALFYVDLVITLAACFLFDVQTGLFSFCGLMAKTLVIDGVIENINLCKYFNVVCDNPKPICDYIIYELGRSATVCRAEGAFSRNDKAVIMTAMSRGQAVRLRNYIKQAEPSAFILISNTSEIIGKGFHAN